MFGMGFTEILIIAVIAILFLGPDKLPGAMVDIAKFFRSAKNAIANVKDTLEEEINVSDIKKEALAYKAQLEDAQSKLSKVTDVKGLVGAELNSMTSLIDEDENENENKIVQSTPTKEPQEVTFKKKKKEEDIIDV